MSLKRYKVRVGLINRKVSSPLDRFQLQYELLEGDIGAYNYYRRNSVKEKLSKLIR